MKKTARILSLALAVLMLGVLFVSCSGKPSGTYVGSAYTLKFSGSKVTVVWKGLLETYELSGSFKIEGEDGNRTITFDLNPGETGSEFGDLAVQVQAELVNGTHSYNAGKDDGGKFVEIDGAKYYKQKS